MATGLRGVSAASLAAVLQVVEDSQGDLAAVGNELFSVAAALDATPAVRRILTDPSTEADARSGVAASVLGGKVSAATLAVVDAAARGRWTSGRALSDAVELAGLAAHVAAADREGSLDTVESELFETQRIIDAERELRATLSDRTIPVDRKARLVDTIFSEKVAPATLALLRQASAGRTGSFDAVLERFADEVAARRSRTLAEVRSATALSDADLERLASALSKKYGKQVHLNTIVDPTIIGGLKITIGDDVIDGTIAGRLGRAFPFGTLGVNVGGSLALGVMFTIHLSIVIFLPLATGLIGAFTTFSTWAFESHRLAEDGEGRLGALNFTVSLAAGIVAVWAGREIGAML